MKTFKSYIACIAVAVLSLLPGADQVQAQQDPQYSQYMFNRILINPAYAGNRNVTDISIGYRSQWMGLDNSPRTAVLTAQLPLMAEKAGIGAELISDKLGARSGNGLLVSYSYRLRAGRGQFAMGVKGGIFNYHYDLNMLEFKDQADVYNTNNITSKITGNADFGCLYYTNSFYAGLSATHLNRGRMSDFAGDSARLARHLFFETGKAFKSGQTVINPVLLIKMATGAPASIDLGVNALFAERLWVGGSYRMSYGFVFLSQYLISESLRAGYSIDLGTNQIGRIGGASHEIMLQYKFSVPGSKILMPRYL